ncbi:alpha/beta fold hydrolase [Alienimonas californiensis]|uniref:AB hydrolase superfamily protein YdjP n=1 Tax=Alienimonas californiensis TaxID=2527989 RepID=A0A517PAQ8_9PLAN|nr:alpha/beta hydrolase [Alienimonas californiensis]QDT16454.1 AB hydrolase superfamily protein YdjP [Alienimonas californiensis]
MLRSPLPTLVLLSALLAGATPAAADGPVVPPAGWTQGRVLTEDGARLNYWRTGGDKPPLLLLHGFSDDGLCWTEVAAKLEADYDVIMTDARGHGLSDPPAAGDQMAAQVRDIGTVIAALELKNPIVMGHSMGSASAATFAAASPEAPRAVVLVDPRLTPWPQRDGEGNDDPDRERRAMRQILDRNNTSYEDLLATCQRQDPGWSRTESEYWARSKQLYHPHLARRSKGERQSMGELFSKITAPTLILKADASAEEQTENQQIADGLKNGKLVHVPDAGHSVHRDELGRFLQELDGFLDGLE